MVTRTWDRSRFLVGFMSRQQVEPLIEQASQDLSQSDVETLWIKYRAARQYVAKLQPESPASIRPEDLPRQFKFREEEVRKTPEFEETYGERSFRFSMVDASQLNVFQLQARAGGRQLSKDPVSILDECLPKAFGLDADYQITRDAAGTVQVTAAYEGASIHVGKIRVDHVRNALEIPFIPNRNWLQVASYEKRYWLHNGHHRVVNYLFAGITRLPCIIFETSYPEEVVGGAIDLRAFERLRKMPRPPLIKDFNSAATMEMPVRRHRTAIVLTIQTLGEHMAI